MSELLRDEELMERIREEDEEAFRQLIERHQDRVYGTVAKMLGGTGPDVEDGPFKFRFRVKSFGRKKVN